MGTQASTIVVTSTNRIFPLCKLAAPFSHALKLTPDNFVVSVVRQRASVVYRNFDHLFSRPSDIASPGNGESHFCLMKIPLSRRLAWAVQRSEVRKVFQIGAARSYSERAAPSAHVGNRFGLLRLSGQGFLFGEPPPSREATCGPRSPMFALRATRRPAPRSPRPLRPASPSAAGFASRAGSGAHSPPLPRSGNR